MVSACRNNRCTPEGGDWLTGLLNRGDLPSRLSTLLAEVQGSSNQVAVFWVNIDRFRQINNSFGHAVGDSVLIELSRRLDKVKPDQGVLARMGGDEFALIMPCGGEADARHQAQSILSGLGRPLRVGTRQLHPSSSIGVALSDAEDSASELLERADRLMLEAKRLGGGQIVWAPVEHKPGRGGMHLAREELSIEEMLHRSLETGGLYLDYQPIIRVVDRVPLAVEALMRCRVGDEIIAPGRFIPVAEKTGLITHLGDWSLVTAAEFISRLRRQGLNLNVAVNVSRAQLLTPAFTRSLHGVLAYTDIKPEQLELEITESLFMDSSDAVQKNLSAALEAGFPLALDDFGTGYSSLACLKDLPAGKIKLDRAFVIDLPHDRRSFGVAKAVSQLAADLGITVVAEGVETAEQYESLCQAGVSAIQGFYIARPMGELELLKWISA
jgi:diguanylate cyclase (GGDEF)-like protein